MVAKKDTTVSTVIMAKYLGISVRHLQRLTISKKTKDGVIRNAGYGRYEIAETFKTFVEYQVEVERKKHSIDDAGLADAGKMEKILDVKIKQLKFDQESGKFVERAIVEKEMFAIVRGARDVLLKMSDRVGDLVAAESDSTQTRLIIRSEVNNALDELEKIKPGERGKV